jgi:hypothetical protein
MYGFARGDSRFPAIEMHPIHGQHSPAESW